MCVCVCVCVCVMSKFQIMHFENTFVYYNVIQCFKFWNESVN